MTSRAGDTTLEGHTDTVTAVCPIIAGGCTLLASAGNDRTVRLWTPATGRLERTLEGHTSPVTKPETPASPSSGCGVVEREASMPATVARSHP